MTQSYFNNDGAQHYLILQPLYYTLKRLGDTEKFVSWKSKATPATSDNSLSPSIEWYENYFTNFYLIFKGNCLKEKNPATFTPPNIIFFFIDYELGT